MWGQVPNMAARLQAAGEPGQIVVSGDTADLVAGLLRAGIARLPDAEGHRASGAGLPRPAAQRCAAPPRGAAADHVRSRPEASAWLRGALGPRRESGTGGRALVPGEPGIGKSRLLLEFSSELAGRGAHRATIFCSRRGSLSPLQPFGEVMGEVPATPQEAAGWVEDQARLRAPVLLVVEDAHWADPSTLEAVHVIARGTARILVSMSARPEIADDPHVQPDAQLTWTAEHRRGAPDCSSGCRRRRSCSRSVRERTGAARRRRAALPRGAGPRPDRRVRGRRLCHADDPFGGDHGSSGPSG